MRQHYHVDFDDEYGDNGRWPVTEGDFDDNATSSEVIDSDLHAPVFDFDFPCRLVPSSTPGHFHLYIDKEIEWAHYVLVMEAMQDAGLLEEGFVRNSVERGAGFLRNPGVRK